MTSPHDQPHVAEARAALVASLSNLVDSQLQSRAEMLHDTATVLQRQEDQVRRATDGLRREGDRLASEADGAARRLKEVGNVQNWAEVLERGFLVLEETVRLAAEGDGDGNGSCSCSECGEGERREDVRDGRGDVAKASSGLQIRGEDAARGERQSRDTVTERDGGTVVVVPSK